MGKERIPPLPVIVAMVYLGHVRMGVGERRMPVRMRVRLSRWIGGQVLMLVVLIVSVDVLVLHGVVGVDVFVPPPE